MTQSATLSLHTVDYPFETLSQRAKASPPKLILDPDFQRKYKWDKDGWGRASKFIESCLMRIPLPSCYFAENEDRAHLVIDGVQRITTIIRFMDDEFALEGMSAFPELEGKKFSELGTLGADFESTTIRCVVLRNENPPELIAEIFSRLNKGAVELSDQEIRHALFAGKFDRLLGELSAIPTITNFKMGKAGQSPKDSREGEELVLRYFAFKENGGDYGDNLTKFLDKFMERSLQFDDERINDLRNEFQSSLAACKILFADDEIFSDISRDRRRQGVVYYDLLMGSLGAIDPAVLKDRREQIRTAFTELCASPDFRRLTAGGVQRKTSIARRNALWKTKLSAAIA
ncbi:DUF262 domain-containing protein [Brevundimonas sp. SL130]|uniref:DUF262 domain-containing protein n=1 Tax=Brevundimonas sp. SL130 TaxID=2995143 RepID=UPI00226D23A7|nr:DUF262 domain-containing protein [Brevundimonas sp. SL130]WAC61219.1 DUF262 domain-containing protein [Brevundimonas sp. SL130]